jgi:hypothetical protein
MRMMMLAAATVCLFFAGCDSKHAEYAAAVDKWYQKLLKVDADFNASASKDALASDFADAEVAQKTIPMLKDKTSEESASEFQLGQASFYLSMANLSIANHQSRIINLEKAEAALESYAKKKQPG